VTRLTSPRALRLNAGRLSITLHAIAQEPPMTDRAQIPTPQAPARLEELTTQDLDEVAGGDTGAPVRTTQQHDFRFVILS
jgi:hypothetical protein